MNYWLSEEYQRWLGRWDAQQSIAAGWNKAERELQDIERREPMPRQNPNMQQVPKDSEIPSKPRFKCPEWDYEALQEVALENLDANKRLIRRFVFKRNTDIHGHSGLGYVIEGVQFSNGLCAITWKGDKITATGHLCIESIIELHGMGHDTELIWLD